MKSPLSNIVKSPITSLMGLSLFVLTSLGVYNGKFEVMNTGAILYGLSLALFLFTDKELKTWLAKAFNLALAFFKKSAPIFLLLILASSCGVLKNVKRDKVKTEMETDSAAHVKTKTELDEKTETVTTITSEADTSAQVKGSTVTGSTPEKELDRKPLVVEDENQKITVSKDSAGNLQVTGVVKDRTVNLKFKKHVEQKVITDRETTTKSDSKVSESKTASSETKTTDKDVRRYGGGAIWLFVILAILAALYLTLRKRVPWLP